MLDQSNKAEWMAGWIEGARCARLPHYTKQDATIEMCILMRCAARGTVLTSWDHGFVSALSAAVGAL